MGRLKILAGGLTPQAQAQGRGQLFEKLMAVVLRHYGYRIDIPSNVNYAGMEIDIEGRAIATGIPLYAECKCYETAVDAPKFQAFYGKYMARWRKDKRCQGIFIALPGVNNHVKGFYRENCEGDPEATILLYGEEQVLQAIFDTQVAVTPGVIARLIGEDIGKSGEWLLLYTDKGIYWIQYVIPPGGGIPNSIAFADAQGNLLSDKVTIDYLLDLWPELSDFKTIIPRGSLSLSTTSGSQDMEEIVQVRGSSACFEYQFPTSPEYFVGRQPVLDEVDLFTQAVLAKETSCRGILFEANSGWGKSSVVLASVARLQSMGHFAVAIDSRSASSSQFILRVVEYTLNKFGDFGGLITPNEKPPTISGFDGAVKAVIDLAQILERHQKLLFIFLDQFENIFFRQDALSRIRDLFLKVCDAQTNVVLGFSWKNDLIGLTSEFPYQLRDALVGSSKRIRLEVFSDVETTALLEKLSEELRAQLRRDLKFFLSEFSQGYPWLLKKLCAHVKSQRAAGVQQSDIADNLLKVEELFQEDLRDLSAEQEDALRRIAKAAPISIMKLDEEFKPDVVQSLVNARLVVRIGNKYDVYWDIFRDYLNSGHVPVQENYMIRLQVGSAFKAAKVLAEASGTLSIPEFQKQAGFSETTFYNIMRDMRLLGLARVENGTVSLQISLPREAEDFTTTLRVHLRERLPRNRLVWQIRKSLESSDALSLEDIADILAKSSPYVSASKETWQVYARAFTDWMDIADLAIFDSTNKLLLPMAAVNERGGLLARRRINVRLAPRRSGMIIPSVQYKPIERAITRIVQMNNRVEWTSFKKSTIYKVLRSLEGLGFITISPKTQSIEVLPKGLEFVANPERRSALFAEGALKMPVFATFIDILRTHQYTGLSFSELSKELTEKLGMNWKASTSETNIKIMLNWARCTNLAPGIFKDARKGVRGSRKRSPLQDSLFQDINDEQTSIEG